MRLTISVSIHSLLILILMILVSILADINVTYATSSRITGIYVDRCMDIVERGYYELVGDVEGTQTYTDYCIRIFANNVVLDGKGYKLRNGFDYKDVGVIISKYCAYKF